MKEKSKSKKKTISVNLSVDLIDYVKEVAELNERSISWTVESMIKKFKWEDND